MASNIPTISLTGLALTFVPPAIALVLMAAWRAKAFHGLYALARMLLQLIAIGYLLVYVFKSEDYRLVLLVLAVMLFFATRIAVRHVRDGKKAAFAAGLVAIGASSLPVLALVTQGVIGMDPWFAPRFLVPLAGMIFAGAMNAVSLGAERFQAESLRGVPVAEARRTAFEASLIPVTNTLLAVGLVSLPGMMTGQILSGISPLVAVRYQIVVMTMLFGTAGLASGIYLFLRSRYMEAEGVRNHSRQSDQGGRSRA
ncbi:putative ABC transport system permease protein [Geothermobacter ehrlichii]|uniref:Putative ABC transport system permease protein n=1 Tax=Geothermobacter ehrlichii TaxID=213224 RepID=A0A5D3WN87_9BACT|nr:ABC transporter permease [Geothermobacter ehrlichii]TYO99060.1 putative ABC transport system permease protein [Geothermobacter ehrlichii]